MYRLTQGGLLWCDNLAHFVALTVLLGGCGFAVCVALQPRQAAGMVATAVMRTLC